jgi:hypothetical protein
MSWPPTSGWGTDVDRGLFVNIIPTQPGSYPSSGALYLGGDFRNAEPVLVTLRMTDVQWTGTTEFPYLYAGSLEGSGQLTGLTLEGTFRFRNQSCNSLDRSSDCPWGFPTNPPHTQVWEVAEWMGLDTCPAELSSRFAVGDRITLPPTGEATVGSHTASCIVQDGYKGLCGATESFEVDGVPWLAVTRLRPGNSYLGEPTQFSVRAGPVDGSDEGACVLYASIVNPVQGTGLTPDGI